MKYVITTDCIGCHTCMENCPVEAIQAGPTGRPEIDQSKCVQCGTCYGNCPVEAIEEEN